MSEEIFRLHSLLRHPGKKKMYIFIKDDYNGSHVIYGQANKCMNSCVFCAQKKRFTHTERDFPICM